jgi:hypothetical protein
VPGMIQTTEREIRVYSDEEAAELLGCLEEDVARWIGWGLVDYVPLPHGQACITRDEVVYLRKLAKHPNYRDWPYDRLLWKRYEIAHEQDEQRRTEQRGERQQEPVKVRRRQQVAQQAEWDYADYWAETEHDFIEPDEDDPRKWRQSMGLERSSRRQEPARRVYGVGAPMRKQRR